MGIPNRMEPLKAFAYILTLSLSAGLNNVTAPSYSCPEFNVDFDGHDVNHVTHVKDWHDCGAICELEMDCRFWTWTTDHNCWLKSSDAGLQQDSDISGVRGCK